MKYTGLSKDEHREMAMMLAVAERLVADVAVVNNYAKSSRVHRAWRKASAALNEYRNALDEDFDIITAGAGSYFGRRPDETESVSIERVAKLGDLIRERQRQERESRRGLR